MSTSFKLKPGCVHFPSLPLSLSLPPPPPPSLSRSIVRDAMVEIMLGAMAPPRQQQQQLILGGRGGAEQAHSVARERPGLEFGGHECYEGGETERDWGGGVVGRASPDNPARCIMWCAIALGALVRGSPIEYVRSTIGYSIRDLR